MDKPLECGGVNLEKSDKEHEGKTRKKKDEKSAFAGAGKLVKKPRLWKMEDLAYYLVQKKQKIVDVSTWK